MKSIGLPVASLLLMALPSFAGNLVYKTPHGVKYTVTEEGLSEIKVGDRTFATGTWSAWNAEGWFKIGTKKVATKAVSKKTFQKTGDASAKVTHVRGDINCIFRYEFAGEDVTISTRINNDNPDHAMEAVGFSGLEFQFEGLPEGVMPVQHISYFQAHGIKLCHPGQWSRIGGSYAIDKSAGVGLTPWKTGIARTLILWNYASWAQDKREKDPRRRPMFFSIGTIPPRGARTVGFRMRVSLNHDWKHLLTPYREHFHQTFGEVRYKPDHRWIATDYLNHSQKIIGPDNPYGFHGNHRRIDTADGAKKFCDYHIPSLKEANGQGAIVWGQGGDDPRGCMYRPDFDILPPEVEANWPAIAKAFKDAGLKIGVCTRPRHMAVKVNWKKDRIIDINPDDRGHREMLLKRFTDMIEKGCTLFYLDSFGNSFEDVKLMMFLREKLGPDILTYCEHQCDAIMPFSGGYSETTLHARDPNNPRYRLWSGMRNWEIYRFLAPGCQMASRHYQTEGKPPNDVETADSFFYKHKVTPLVPHPRPERVKVLKSEQVKYLDSSLKWK